MQRQKFSAGRPPRNRLSVGNIVYYRDVKCIIRFIGRTHFAKGVWVGLEMEEPYGKNDGSVEGRVYFNCPRGHGLFCRPAYVTPITAINHHRFREQDAGRPRSPAFPSQQILNHGVPRRLVLRDSEVEELQSVQRKIASAVPFSEPSVLSSARGGGPLVHQNSVTNSVVGSFVFGEPIEWDGHSLRISLPSYDPRFHSCDFEVGDVVQVKRRVLSEDPNIEPKGKVAFIGYTWEAPGLWIGVELQDNLGNTDGYGYFECPLQHGVFLRASAVMHEAIDNKPPSVESSASSEVSKLRVSFEDPEKKRTINWDVLEQRGAMKAAEQQRAVDIELYVQCLQEQAERRRNLQDLEDAVAQKSEYELRQYEEKITKKEFEQAKEAQKLADRIAEMEYESVTQYQRPPVGPENDSTDPPSTMPGSIHSALEQDEVFMEIVMELENAALQAMKHVRDLTACCINSEGSFVSKAKSVRDAFVDVSQLTSEMKHYLAEKEQREIGIEEEDQMRDLLDLGSALLKAAGLLKKNPEVLSHRSAFGGVVEDLSHAVSVVLYQPLKEAEVKDLAEEAISLVEAVQL